MKKSKQKTSGLKMQSIIEAVNKGYGRKTCFYPDRSQCSNRIINAHTIQKSGGLSTIARNGAVYGSQGTTKTIVDGLMPMRLVGISQASTFTGFCGYHDREVFLPLETQPFTGSAEQYFLMMYRAVCRELYQKQGAVATSKNIAQVFLNEARAAKSLPPDLSTMLAGQEAGVKDLEHCKSLCDTMLQTKNYTDLRYYSILLTDVPDIMCAGAVQPQVDFEGNAIISSSDYANLNIIHRTISLTITSVGGKGIVAFAWIDENSGENLTNENLVRSFDSLPDSEKLNAIFRFAFEYFENVFARPEWWEGLSEEQQKAIDRLRFNFSAYIPSQPIENVEKMISWSMEEIKSNVPGLPS